MDENNYQQSSENYLNLAIDRSKVYKVDLHLDHKNDVRVIAYNYIAENTTILDVGCACGDFGKLLQSKNCNVYGMEYDARGVAIASNTGAYKLLYQVDLNNFFEDDYEQYLNYFDSITFLDVLEHILEPEKILSSFSRFLKDEGHFIVSLPNVSFCDIKADLLNNNFTYTDTGILDRTHIKFYTHKSIAKMMTLLNLEIVECNPKVSYFSKKEVKIPISIIRHIKKDPHSFVYQYVLKIKPSVKNKTELENINNSMMDVKWGGIYFELNRLKKIRWLQIIFPTGSLQNKWARKLKSKHMKRK